MNMPKNDLKTLAEQAQVQIEQAKGLQSKSKKAQRQQGRLRGIQNDVRNEVLQRFQHQENNLAVLNYDPIKLPDNSMAEEYQATAQAEMQSINILAEKQSQEQAEYNEVLDFQEYINTGQVTQDSGVEMNPSEIQNIIIPEMDGVDISKIAQVESGNNYQAQNLNSSAYGKYQFIDSTRDSIAHRLGITDPKSPQSQELIMQAYVQDNTRILEKHNLPVNTLSVYAMHQQGAGGGIALLQGNVPSGSKLEHNIINNTPSKYRTGNPVQDWMTAWSAKLS